MAAVMVVLVFGGGRPQRVRRLKLHPPNRRACGGYARSPAVRGPPRAAWSRFLAENAVLAEEEKFITSATRTQPLGQATAGQTLLRPTPRPGMRCCGWFRTVLKGVMDGLDHTLAGTASAGGATHAELGGGAKFRSPAMEGWLLEVRFQQGCGRQAGVAAERG